MEVSSVAILDWIGSLFGYIIFFGYKISGVYVIGLFLFTIAVKLVLFPLSIKQQKTMAKQSRLSPKLQEIKERCGNDKQRYNQEMMELYQREGANPSSGCLPLLLQFPIIMGLYQAVVKPLSCVLHMGNDVINQIMGVAGVNTTTNYYYQINFIQNFNSLSQDQMNQISQIVSPGDLEHITGLANGGFNFLGLNLLGTPGWNILIIIPILCFVSSMAMSLYTMRLSNSNQPGGGCMKWGMPIFMSVFSTWIAFSVPGAVGFYWFLSNLLSMVQSYVMNKFYNGHIMNAKDEAARIARRRQEEGAVMAAHQGFVLAEAAQRLRKKEMDLEQQKLDEERRKQSYQSNKESLEGKSWSNEKVIKTGNAARSGNVGKKKKK